MFFDETRIRQIIIGNGSDKILVAEYDGILYSHRE